MFIDETWAKTNMTRTSGRAPRSQRLHAKVPYGHWKTMTFIAALRHDRIEAPLCWAGPVNGTCFLAYVQHVLVPTLSPGDIVVMDNLPAHKLAAVRTNYRGGGGDTSLLAPYSPDLNPQEDVWQRDR